MLWKQLAGFSDPEAEKETHETSSFSDLMKIGAEQNSFLLAKG